MNVLVLHTIAIRKQNVGIQLEDLSASVNMDSLGMVFSALVGPEPQSVNYSIYKTFA